MSETAPEQLQSGTGSAPPPVPFSRLKEIANDACASALSSASSYEHTSTESWNTAIINTILQSLISETSTSTTQPQFKFAVNSTIIQHAPSDAGANEGRRGMHSAAGAYWNAEKDGMWSFKYEAAEAKGLDVVVGIIWISV